MGENKNLGLNLLDELKNRTLLITLLLVLLLLVVFIAGYSKTKVKAENDKKLDQELYVDVHEGLRMRKDPSFYADTVKNLSYLAKVTPLAREEGWIFVTDGNDSGWIFSKYVTNILPKQLSVRDLDFKELVQTKQGVTSLQEPEYGDFNQDGREEVLLTVLTNSEAKQKDYYIYGYENGLVLKKYLTLNPTTKPELYGPGFRGFNKLEPVNGLLKLSYPIYNENDPLSRPSGGITEKYFYWSEGIYKLK